MLRESKGSEMGKRYALCLGLVLLLVTSFFQGNASADEKYRVRRGDTLAKISKKFGVSVKELRSANGIKGSALRKNQILVIPERDGKHPAAKRGGKSLAAKEKKRTGTGIYIVKRGDTLRSIAADADISVRQLKKMNRLRTASLRRGQRLVVPRRAIEEPPAASDDDAEGPLIDDDMELFEERPDPNPKIGKWNGSEERSLFIRVVKTFLGVPYRYGGSSIRGLDCSSFVKKIYAIFDVDLPRTAREQSRVGKWVMKEDLEEGDLVFFRTRRVSDHVGIYIGNNEFVHLSSKNREAKVDRLSEPYFEKRFIRGVRIKELSREENNQAKL